jgi:hypothetical protein
MQRAGESDRGLPHSETWRNSWPVHGKSPIPCGLLRRCRSGLKILFGRRETGRLDHQGLIHCRRCCREVHCPAAPANDLVVVLQYGLVLSLWRHCSRILIQFENFACSSSSRLAIQPFPRKQHPSNSSQANEAIFSATRSPAALFQGRVVEETGGRSRLLRTLAASLSGHVRVTLLPSTRTS